MQKKTEKFILDLIIESGIPLGFVDFNKEFIFTTKAFDELLGLKKTCVKCDSIIISAFDINKKNTCCFEVLEALSKKKEPGLWIIKREGGNFSSILSKITPVSFGSKHIGLLIEVRPVEEGFKNNSALQAMESFLFQKNQPESLLPILTRFLIEDYSPSLIWWIKLKDKVESLYLKGKNYRGKLINSLLEVLKDLQREFNFTLPFDLFIQGEIFHIFPTSEKVDDKIFLVLKGLPFEIETSDIKKIRSLVDIATRVLNKKVNMKDKKIGEENNISLPFLFNLNLLSKREREILSLLCEGYSDKMIAERLSLSPFTVKNHIISAMNKLGVNKRTKLVALYLSLTQDTIIK